MKGALLFLLIFVVLIAVVFVVYPFVKSFVGNLNPFGGTKPQVVGPVAEGNILRSEDGGSSWVTSAAIENTSLALGADVFDIAFDLENRDLVLAGTLDRGLYQSENSGKTWASIIDGDGTLTTNSTVYRILFSQEIGHPVYLAAFQNGLGAVLRAENDLADFETVFTAPAGVAVNDIAQDPSDFRLYVGTAQGGFFESRNGGDSWRLLRWFPGSVLRIGVNPQNRQVFVFTRESRLFKSDSQGAGWIELTDAFKDLPGQKAADIRVLEFDPFQRNVMYLGTGLGLLRSSDFGASWNLARTIVPPEFLPIQAIAVSPRSSQHFFISAANQVYRTLDNGQTWSVVQLGVAKPIRVIMIDPFQPSRVLVGLGK